MKDMGRCGNVAFSALVLFYCSFITGDHLCISAVHTTTSPSIHSSVKRRNGVSDVNMTSSLKPESPNSDQAPSSTNHTNTNITDPTPHAHTSAVTSVPSSWTVTPSLTTMENISFSGNIPDSRNESDLLSTKNPTTVTRVTPTTLLPSTTHYPKTKIYKTTFLPKSTRPSDVTSPKSITTRTRQKSSQTTLSHVATTLAVTTGMPASSSPVQANTHVDTPSALNVGDDDNNLKVSSDPLLAGLVSAFVVIAAIVSVLIFLKFRSRNDGPEFHRLQDVPMDDMLEDAPLSMYSY
ncbi:mucin-5AC [Xyrauchen texanus]|uniref:mucin-5AC n=1 Tax=Xyrauchen texanus TaxID=154827 RepID=UPI002241D090|nr:mucin-5AC [Xyrauchen texanus]